MSSRTVLRTLTCLSDPMETPLTARQYLMIFAITFLAGFVLIAVRDLAARYL